MRAVVVKAAAASSRRDRRRCSAERRSVRQRNRDSRLLFSGSRRQSRDHQGLLLARHAPRSAPARTAPRSARSASVVPSAGTKALVSSFASSETCAIPVRSSSEYVPDHRQRRQMNRKIRPRQRAARELRVVRLVDRVRNRRPGGIDREIGDVKTQPRAGRALEQNQAVLFGRKEAHALRRAVGGESRRRDDVGGGDAARWNDEITGADRSSRAGRDANATGAGRGRNGERKLCRRN